MSSATMERWYSGCKMTPDTIVGVLRTVGWMLCWRHSDLVGISHTRQRLFHLPNRFIQLQRLETVPKDNHKFSMLLVRGRMIGSSCK